MENDNFVMMDTCTISQIFGAKKINNDAKLTTHNNKVIKELFNTNKCPLITDLSFVEIIIGLNKENFHYILDSLEKCEFVIFSTNPKFSEYIDFFKKSNITFDEIVEIKTLLLKIKAEVLFPLFMDLFDRYMKMLVIILSQFNELFYNFFSIITDYNIKFKDLIIPFLKILLDDAIINHKKLDLYKSVHELVVQFFRDIYSKPNFISGDINENDETDINNIIKVIDEVFKKNENKMPSASKKILIEMKNKIEYKFDEKEIDKTLEYMLLAENIRHKKCIKLGNDYIQEYIIEYITNSYLFDGIKFKINDLVDAYNCMVSFNNQYKISYYTSDDRWKKFLKYIEIVNENFKSNY